MSLKYPNLKSMGIDDLKLFQGGNATICELSPANLIIWKEFDHPKITYINDNLCVLISPLNEAPFFLEPIGRNRISETVETCLKDSGKLSRLSEGFISGIDPKNYRIACSRDHFDYLYETKTLAELKGKKYDGKRNHLKNFQNRHPDYQYVELEAGMKGPCLKLFEEWFAIRKESRYFPKLAYTAQKQAVENAFLFFEPLRLAGGAVMIENELKGFILGSQLNSKTIAVHFLYAHPSLHGIFPAALWEACNKTFAKYPLINLEQDLGIPGLRKSKLSYHPLKLEKKFEISAAET